MDTPATPVTYIELYIGLTPWFNLSQHRPEKMGWYRTRLASKPTAHQPQRCWWDGSYFSFPILTDDTEDEIEYKKRMHRLSVPSDIEWCGLLAPHLAGYLYQFYPSPRADALHQVEKVRDTLGEGVK